MQHQKTAVKGFEKNQDLSLILHNLPECLLAEINNNKSTKSHSRAT